MSVRKIRNSWWVDFRFEGVRYRKRSPENSRRGAEAYEATLRARAARGESLNCQAKTGIMPTLEEFARDWLKTWVPANYKHSTAMRAADSFRVHLVPWFGQQRLDEITTQDLERFKAARRQDGISPYTINNEMTQLRACLRTAKEWEILDALPEVRWLPTPKARPRFLTIEEVYLLVDSAKEPLWKDLIWVAVHTGLRFGELIALEWCDIDFDRRQVTVERNEVDGVVGTPKNGQTRYLPMTDKVYEVLRRRQRREGRVFALPDGRPIYHEAASRALHRACKQARIDKVGWHIMRHSFASNLVMRGVPLPAVQQLLGHSKIEMTMRYAHLAPDAHGRAVAVFNNDADDFGHPVGNVLPSVPVTTPPGSPTSVPIPA